ncbi:MAG: hypothetical protein WCW36_02315 [Candidatus Paceibacterota bacterium]
MGTEITITRPDDWRLNLSDGKQITNLLEHSTSRFRRALIAPGMTTVALASEYRQRILAVVPNGVEFIPLMVLRITPETPWCEIFNARECNFICALETETIIDHHSLYRMMSLLTAAESMDFPISINFGVTDPCDGKSIIDNALYEMVYDLPNLRININTSTDMEHTAKFVESAGKKVTATIAVQHLLSNKMLKAATSGNPRFFLGTGATHASLELCAEEFASIGRLDMLEGFASHFGADFFRVPRNTSTITLVREDWVMPTGQMIKWKIKE